jgi:hypothetical protein
MEMRFSTLSIRSLYRAGSLVTLSKELSNYVQEVRLVGVTGPAGEYTSLYGKGNERHQIGTLFCT